MFFYIYKYHIIVFGFFCTLLEAQVSTISGRVQDPGGDKLAGANIIVKNTEYGTATDKDGKFTFFNVPDGNYSVFPDITGVPVDTSGLNNITISAGQDSFTVEFTADSNSIYTSMITGLNVGLVDFVQVWPNPIGNSLFLKTANKVDMLSLYDNLGSRIYAEHIYNDGVYELKLNTIPGGVYYLELMISNKRLIKKVIKL